MLTVISLRIIAVLAIGVAINCMRAKSKSILIFSAPRTKTKTKTKRTYIGA